MASFAVQTIQNVLKSSLAERLRRRRADAGLDVEFDADGECHFGNDKRQGNVSSLSPSDETARDAGVVESAQKEGESKEQQEERQLPEDARKRIEATLRDWNKPHAFYVARSHKRIDERLASVSRAHSEVKINEGNESERRMPPDTGSEAEKEADAEERKSLELAEREADRVLTEYVLELAVELEKHARRLLLAHMEEGSNARMLLKADRIVQLRNVRALAKQEIGSAEAVNRDTDGETRSDTKRTNPINALMHKYYEEESELLPAPTDLDERETLEEVTRYRESFAGLLAAGGRLLGLKDEERRLFERRLKETEVGEDEATST